MLSKIKVGDILYVNRGYYKHYGVYIGEGKIIHFAPLNGAEINSKNAVIHETNLDDFLKGGEPEIDKKSKSKYNRLEIVKRACSQVGSNGYNLVFSNCEHFARWCKTGIHESNQVDEAMEIVVESVGYGLNVLDGIANSKDKKKLLSKLEKFLK